MKTMLIAAVLLASTALTPMAHAQEDSRFQDHGSSIGKCDWIRRVL